MGEAGNCRRARGHLLSARLVFWSETRNYGLIGEEVVGQGKYGTDFYMIISGQAEVTQRAGEIGETVSVGQLGPRYVETIQFDA